MQLAKVTAAALVAAFGLADLASAGSAGRCGGATGINAKTLTCPDGEYIAAIGARGGLFIDEFSIACRKIPVTGQPGALGGYKSGGPGGGTASKSAECDKGHAVRFIHVKSGALMDKVISAGCRGRSGENWARESPGSTARLDIGGGGGIACTLSCPSNEAMYRIIVRYGGVVDSIRGECRR